MRALRAQTLPLSETLGGGMRGGGAGGKRVHGKGEGCRDHPSPSVVGATSDSTERLGEEEPLRPGKAQAAALTCSLQPGGRVNTWGGRPGPDAVRKGLRPPVGRVPSSRASSPHSPFPATPARRHLPSRQLLPGRSAGSNVSLPLRPAPAGSARPGRQSRGGGRPLSPARTYPRPWPPPPGPPG